MRARALWKAVTVDRSNLLERFFEVLRNHEVDFVLRSGKALVAIEVKSGRAPEMLAGLGGFAETFKPRRTLLVGGDGMPLDELLGRPVEHLLRP